MVMLLLLLLLPSAIFWLPKLLLRHQPTAQAMT
jgi:hypothetical protein